MDPSPHWHVDDVVQILEKFGFEPSQENVDVIMSHHAIWLEEAVSSTLEGLMDPILVSGLKQLFDK